LEKDDLIRILIDPYYAINVAPDIAVDYQPIISKIDWIKANRRLIDELGADKWLVYLLSILEGEYPASQKRSPSLRVTRLAMSNRGRAWNPPSAALYQRPPQSLHPGSKVWSWPASVHFWSAKTNGARPRVGDGSTQP